MQELDGLNKVARHACAAAGRGGPLDIREGLPDRDRVRKAVGLAGVRPVAAVGTCMHSRAFKRVVRFSEGTASERLDHG